MALGKHYTRRVNRIAWLTVWFSVTIVILKPNESSLSLVPGIVIRIGERGERDGEISEAF